MNLRYENRQVVLKAINLMDLQDLHQIDVCGVETILVISRRTVIVHLDVDKACLESVQRFQSVQLARKAESVGFYSLVLVPHPSFSMESFQRAHTSSAARNQRV